ncbi:DNA polymerase III subunit alpha, partial [Candidatus Woesearchaeota archaeon]
MGVKREFVHLHLHSQYSLLDGACHLERIIEKTKALDMKAVAITDHGNMFGVIDFYILANSSQLKPIIGVEFYEAPTSRFDKSQSLKSKEDTNFHLVALAKDNTGYKNLLKLVSLSYLEGFYYKPRINKRLIAQYSEGIICLSACLKGEIPHLLLSGNQQQAKEVVNFYKSIFPDKFYLEIQNHGIEEEKIVAPLIIELAR